MRHERLLALLLTLHGVAGGAPLPTSAASPCAQSVLEDDTLQTGSDAFEWGGVAEARLLMLRPEGLGSSELRHGVLRLNVAQPLSSSSRLVAQAQAEWLDASEASALALVPSALAQIDRALPLVYSRDRATRRYNLGWDWLYWQRSGAAGRITLGRQPIATSIGKIWSPADTLAPFHPSDLERLYKPGVDALQLAAYVAEGSTLNGIVSVRRVEGELQWKWQQRLELDRPWGKAALMLGGRHGQRIAGAALQVNDVVGSDLYGELLWHRAASPAPVLQDRQREGLRAILGASRHLASDTTATLEYFRQSDGQSDPAHYVDHARSAAATDLPFMGMGRHYLGFSLNTQLHPLLALDAIVLANLSDHSASATAALAYTPLPNLKLRASLALPIAGRPTSEYRSAGAALQVGLQSFF
ncbi:hypothetical protein RQP53_00410 [Paucibacter sp. APW11]|uniref:Haemolysin activator HlyB C-terminal domain-containing protein n=1 Tax=Roseateles aquae TaxID=3077235 RepID=A0ABU3P578_9BURK|nr:hypothetical protein [Paucibacter sp. APW11]MDT8997730.1 hypothetical protein [Paucibacter sp. APW11]